MADDLTAWLDGLVALAGKATKGKRRTTVNRNDESCVWVGEHWLALLPHQCVRALELQSRHDAALIAALDPDAVVALVGGFKAGIAAADALRSLGRRRLEGKVSVRCWCPEGAAEHTRHCRETRADLASFDAAALRAAEARGR